MPEPFGGDFLDAIENEIEQRYPDPLGMMLESCEHSIEQSLPPAAMPGDAQPDMLDLVEKSTEQQRFSGTDLPEHLQDHSLWEVLDALEKSNENQVIRQESPFEPAAPEPDEMYGSFSQAVVPQLGEGWRIREHPYPEYRMTGTRSGIRCSGGGTMYCRLRDIWISEGECSRCPDFEVSETDWDVVGAGECKHISV
jgi:hypothetical protein